MLNKLIDEIFDLIANLVGFILLIVLVGCAYYYAPITTCIVGGILFLGFIISLFDISEAQAEKIETFLAYLLVAVIIGVAFYFFPKSTLIVAALIGIGFILERKERKKAQ